ncbi:hypothetical protein IFM89_002399 [Coptis chinensis]|uniref:Uncharacterized protein n=1 Tax=Coptis chinensis TaxID=261450 RepID=A0A835IK79_9MAGN|nr:hypothetical protein IFM89_002399 [Coptis chinensis]
MMVFEEVRISAEEFLAKLKDDGDFDKPRLKIIQKLKENGGGQKVEISLQMRKLMCLYEMNNFMDIHKIVKGTQAICWGRTIWEIKFVVIVEHLLGMKKGTKRQNSQVVHLFRSVAKQVTLYNLYSALIDKFYACCVSDIRNYPIFFLVQGVPTLDVSISYFGPEAALA